MSGGNDESNHEISEDVNLLLNSDNLTQQQREAIVRIALHISHSNREMNAGDVLVSLLLNNLPKKDEGPSTEPDQSNL